MKEAWSEENNRIEYGNLVEPQTTKSHRPGLLAGLTAPPNRATIVASTPSKEASDRLIDQFFGSYNPAIPARCKFGFLGAMQADQGCRRSP